MDYTIYMGNKRKSSSWTEDRPERHEILIVPKILTSVVSGNSLKLTKAVNGSPTPRQIKEFIHPSSPLDLLYKTAQYGIARAVTFRRMTGTRQHQRQQIGDDGHPPGGSLRFLKDAL